jgi:hypothetical protein
MLTEQEILEKLKEALDYKYMYDSWDWSDDQKEVDNLEDYLRLIKQEREIEKDLDDVTEDRLRTLQEFINYLADKAIGDTKCIIEEFNNCTYVNFEGYKKVTKEIKDNDLYLVFQIGESHFNAKWQAGDNYAVWQTCGYSGDDYSGYLLFPTYKDNEYFVLWYKC